MSTAERVTVQADRQVLTLRLGAERYGLAIDHVTEVVEPDGVTPVPNTGPSVVGVMDLRGQTTTVIDPGRVLVDAVDPAETVRVVVLDTADSEHLESVGWVVDDVVGVVGVDDEDVETPPEDAAEAVEGVHRDDGTFTMLVDPERVTRQATH